jgi:hypothetical protein
VKKSVLVTFGVIMSTLILCSCGEERRCVDADGNVVEDEKCKEADKTRSSGGHGGSRFFWYYGGTHGGVGTRASGGSYTPVSRGGFGGLGALHASAGG